MDSPEYKRCIAREKDRYREWAKTRQGAFETYQVLHFDADELERSVLLDPVVLHDACNF